MTLEEALSWSRQVDKKLISYSSVDIGIQDDSMATTALADPPDLSEPWKFSDIVLAVEDQRFYVHRNILELWSPVFERTFTAAFRDSKDQRRNTSTG